MSYECNNCGMTLAGMETCDCPVGQKAREDYLAGLDQRLGLPAGWNTPSKDKHE